MDFEDAVGVARQMVDLGMNVSVEVRHPNPDAKQLTAEQKKAGPTVGVRVFDPAGKSLPAEVLKVAVDEGLSVATTDTLLQ